MIQKSSTNKDRQGGHQKLFLIESVPSSRTSGTAGTAPVEGEFIEIMNSHLQSEYHGHEST